MMRSKFLIVSILLIFGLGTNVQAQTDCYPDDPSGQCTTIASGNRVTVILPQYPGCPFFVTYDLRICQGELQIANLTAGVPDKGGPCGAFVMDYIQAVFSGDQLTAETYLKELWSSLETEVANALWNSTLDAAQGNLPILYCGSGLTTFTAGFYRGSCVSFCFGQDDDDQITITLVSCGQTCCVKRIEYCLDPVTQEVITEETVEQVNPGECFKVDLPTCPEGNLFQSPCFENCEIE